MAPASAPAAASVAPLAVNDLGATVKLTLPGRAKLSQAIEVRGECAGSVSVAIERMASSGNDAELEVRLPPGVGVGRGGTAVLELLAAAEGEWDAEGEAGPARALVAVTVDHGVLEELRGAGSRASPAVVETLLSSLSVALPLDAMERFSPAYASRQVQEALALAIRLRLPAVVRAVFASPAVLSVEAPGRALQLACAAGDPHVLQSVLGAAIDAGVDLGRATDLVEGRAGVTPLHLAALNPSCYRLLNVLSGYDHAAREAWNSVTDDAGRTPAQYARAGDQARAKQGQPTGALAGPSSKGLDFQEKLVDYVVLAIDMGVSISWRQRSMTLSEMLVTNRKSACNILLQILSFFCMITAIRNNNRLHRERAMLAHHLMVHIRTYNTILPIFIDDTVLFCGRYNKAFVPGLYTFVFLILSVHAALCSRRHRINTGVTSLVTLTTLYLGQGATERACPELVGVFPFSVMALLFTAVVAPLVAPEILKISKSRAKVKKVA